MNKQKVIGKSIVMIGIGALSLTSTSGLVAYASQQRAAAWLAASPGPVQWDKTDVEQISSVPVRRLGQPRDVWVAAVARTAISHQLHEHVVRVSDQSNQEVTSSYENADTLPAQSAAEVKSTTIVLPEKSNKVLKTSKKTAKSVKPVKSKPVKSKPVKSKPVKSKKKITRHSKKKIKTVKRPVRQQTVVSPSLVAVPPVASTSILSQPVIPEGEFSLNRALGLTPQSRIKIQGFMSAGATETNAHRTAFVDGTEVPVTYNIPQHGAIGSDFNFNAGSLVGLQITGHLMNQVSAVVQLVADGDDTNGNRPYRVQAEWAFLRWNLNDIFQARFGRFRIPLFLYSETQQVGYTYPWIFLPNEVYRIVPFENINGIDLIYRVEIGQSGWTIQVEPYYGANSSEFDLYTRGSARIPGIPVSISIPQGKTAEFNENDIVGGVLSVGNQYFIIRATYVSVNLSSFIPNFLIPGVAEITLPLVKNKPAQFYSVGARLNYHNLFLAAEYAHRNTPAQIASLSGYYATVGYYFGQFMPNFTYGRIDTANAGALFRQPISELVEAQRSYTLGIAYYINSNLVVKSSISAIEPISGNGLFTADPGRRTVLLYGVALNAVF